MRKSFPITLDIKKEKPIDLITLVQGDFNSNVFVISIVNNYKAFDLTGLDATIVFAKPDGTDVMQTTKVTGDKISILDATNGIVEVTLKTGALEAVGKVKTEVVLYEGTTRLTSSTFDFKVRKSLEDTAIESSDDLSEIEALKQDLESIDVVDVRNDVAELQNEVYSPDTATITETSDIIDMPVELEKETKVDFKLEGNTVDDGTNVKSTILAGRLKSGNVNLFDRNEITRGKYLSTGGDILSGDAYAVSGYVKVEGNMPYSKPNEYLIHMFDVNKNYIDYTSGTTFTTLQNCEYIRFTVDNTEQAIDSCILVEGTTLPADYIKHEGDKTYILGKDEDGNILEMHSIKDDDGNVVVADEVEDGKCNKRTGKIVIDGTEIYLALDSNATDTYRMYVDGMPNDALPATYNSGNGYSSDGNYTFLSSGSVDTRCIYILDSPRRLYIRIEKSKVDTMPGTTIEEKFKNYIQAYPVTLIYQLAEPKIYELEGITPLTVYPNGRILWENIVTETNEYNSGITINNASLPIQSLDTLYKVNADGSKLKLDTSLSAIAGDGLSFTHPDLTTGNLADYDYYYDSSLSTIPTTTLTVPINLNSRVNNNTDAISVNAQQVLDIYKILIANNLL